MNDIRFSDTHLNSVLMTLINPSEVLIFVTQFKNSRIVINIHSFVESQCRCNILSKYLGVDKELFSSSRKFLHSVIEGTEYHNLSMAQQEFKRLYIVFKQKIAFLNLLMASQFETSIQFKGTLPRKVVEFCRELKAPLQNKAGMCVAPSEFITLVKDNLEVIDYLSENPHELELVLQYIMRYAGALKHLIDYRSIAEQFLTKKNPVVLDAIIDLYFCMYDEAVWREIDE